jgi:hypothetical protein
MRCIEHEKAIPCIDCHLKIRDEKIERLERAVEDLLNRIEVGEGNSPYTLSDFDKEG